MAMTAAILRRFEEVDVVVDVRVVCVDAFVVDVDMGVDDRDGHMFTTQ